MQNESVDHLFFSCPVFTKVWRGLNWMGVSTALHCNSKIHFMQFRALIDRNQKASSRWQVVWFQCLSYGPFG